MTMASPLPTKALDDGAPPAEGMAANAAAASAFLKALAHEGRLMILCHLAAGERSVTELETLLDSRQAAVSQQLARLRLEGLVSCRREGKAIFYALSDPKVRQTVELMYSLFCGPGPADTGRR
jgi:ArsR family transcriptional regulator